MSDIAIPPSLEQELLPMLAGGDTAAAFEELVRHFPKLQSDRENLAVLQRWVDLSLQHGQAKHAFDVLEYCVNYPEAEMDLMEGLCRLKLGDRQEALELFKAARSNPRAQPGTKARAFYVWLMEHGNDLRSSNEVVAAMEAYRQASDIRRDLPAPYVGMGNCQYNLGGIEEAEALARKALSCAKGGAEVEAYHLLSQCGRPEDAASMGEAVDKLLVRPGLGERERTMLHFTRGRFLNMEKNYPRALDHFAQANALLAARHPYDRADYDRQVEALIRAFPREVLERTHDGASDHDGLVFIIGMPRSGTTLCEQILAAHPRVFAGGESGVMNGLLGEVLGELHAQGASWCADLGPERRRALAGRYLASLHPGHADYHWHTDKQPFNFLSVGLIAQMFPKAQFLFCRRHPYDSAISNQEQHFTEVHPFSLSFDRIAHFTNNTRRLFQHWAEVLPERFHSVSYEALAGDPGGEIPQMLEMLGLPWDDACLSPEKVARTVTTASARQVRQAIYSSSSDKWRRYRPEQLAALNELLPDPEDCADYWFDR